MGERQIKNTRETNQHTCWYSHVHLYITLDICYCSRPFLVISSVKVRTVEKCPSFYKNSRPLAKGPAGRKPHRLSRWDKKGNDTVPLVEVRTVEKCPSFYKNSRPLAKGPTCFSPRRLLRWGITCERNNSNSTLGDAITLFSRQSPYTILDTTVESHVN
jgi:hypothetical protein